MAARLARGGAADRLEPHGGRGRAEFARRARRRRTRRRPREAASRRRRRDHLPAHVARGRRRCSTAPTDSSRGSAAGRCCSTAPRAIPPTSRRIAARLAERGVAFADAPVSGGTNGAEAGTLTIMVGGDDGDLRARPPDARRVGKPDRAPGPGRRGARDQGGEQRAARGQHPRRRGGARGAGEGRGAGAGRARRAQRLQRALVRERDRWCPSGC